MSMLRLGFLTILSLYRIVNSVHAYRTNLENKNTIWITIDKNTAWKLVQGEIIISPSGRGLKKEEPGNYTIIEIDESDISNISQYIHTQHGRCGGFVAHVSHEEAKEHMKKYANAIQNRFSFSYVINNGKETNNLIKIINCSRLQDTVDSLVQNFQTRWYKTDDGVQASIFIQESWKGITSSRSDITVDTFSHMPKFKQASIIVTIQGSQITNDIVIIGAHLDSTSNQTKIPTKAPGADDDASGIAVLTEVLYVIVNAGYKPRKTIKIMAFAAEEAGIQGSKAIAKDYRSRGQSVLGMLNFDMVGYKCKKKDIFIYNDDGTSEGQNNFLENLMKIYLPEASFGFSRCSKPCSDHHSWIAESFPASYVSSSAVDAPPPFYHNVKDLEVDKENMNKFAKLAVSYMSELAKSAATSFKKLEITTRTTNRNHYNGKQMLRSFTKRNKYSVLLSFLSVMILTLLYSRSFLFKINYTVSLVTSFSM